jgi:hypothetical protein
VGANTLPLGKEKRKAFVKEVTLGPQSKRIFNEFFEYLGPSWVQHKAIFLNASPQPKVSQSQAWRVAAGGPLEQAIDGLTVRPCSGQ